jgi:arylsulfatase A-like enzyme
VNITQGGICHGLENVQAPRETLPERLKAAGLPPENANLAFLWMDDSLRVIIDKLKEMGAYDDTLIVFAADHGNYPHKATCYDGGSRIPLLMKWTNHFREGMEIDALVSSVDIVPTLLDAAQIQDSEMPLDGKSLWPVLNGDQQQIHESVHVDFGYSRAVFDGRWKYIAVRFPDRMVNEMKSGVRTTAPTLMGSPHVLQAIALYGHPDLLTADQLYDLSKDPSEKNNLAFNPEYAAQLKRMKALLNEYTSDMPHPFPENADLFYFSEDYRELVNKTRQAMPLPDWYGGGK